MDAKQAVIAKLDDNASAEVALIENVQRKSLTPIEIPFIVLSISDLN